MPNALQVFFAMTTPQAAANLVAAYLRLPEARRHWTPASNVRSAFDQMVECTVLSGYTAELLRVGRYPGHSREHYLQAKTDAATLEGDDLQALLQDNTEKVSEAILSIPDSALDIEVDLPWGRMTIAEIIAYPYSIMIYHEGQINLLYTMLCGPIYRK